MVSRENKGVLNRLVELLLGDEVSSKSSKPLAVAGAALGATGLVVGACYWLRKKPKKKPDVDPVAEFMKVFLALTPEQRATVAHSVLSEQVGAEAGSAACALVGAEGRQTFFVTPLPDVTAGSVEFDLSRIDPAARYVVAIAHERLQPSSAQLVAACARMMRQQQQQDDPARAVPAEDADVGTLIASATGGAPRDDGRTRAAGDSLDSTGPDAIAAYGFLASFPR